MCLDLFIYVKTIGTDDNNLKDWCQDINLEMRQI